jgi:hypothetical protein
MLKRGVQQYWKSTHTDAGTFYPFSFTSHNKANQFTIILVNRTQKFRSALMQQPTTGYDPDIPSTNDPHNLLFFMFI